MKPGDPCDDRESCQAVFQLVPGRARSQEFTMIRTAVACATVAWMLAASQTAAQEVQRSAYHDFAP